MTSTPSESDTSDSDQSRSGQGPSDQSPSDTLEQAEFRALVLAWHYEHATPRSAADLWTTPPYLDESAAHESFEAARAWQRTLFEHGWAGLSWPSEFGGAGGEPWMTTIFNDVAAGFEEWAGFLNSTIAMLVPTLLRHGTEEQKHRFILALLSGELAFCQLFSEPGAGSDLAGLATRATLDGDEFIVNGQSLELSGSIL